VSAAPPPGKASTNLQRLGYRRIVVLLVSLILVPTVLLLALGIVLMFLGEAQANLLFGILTVGFVAALVTGAVLVLVFVAREANLSELQSDFVSKVSHELRTPLTAMRLFIETLERSRDDAVTTEKCIEQISAESARLTRLIERLLDWGRMEAGRKWYDKRPVDPADVVNDALEEFATSRYPGLELELELDAQCPQIAVDRSALVDAVSNLLGNAAKYGGTPPRVHVRLHQQGRSVRISVRDNGMGIAKGEQRQIFQKFYRIDDRFSRAQQGSGLGLAIVKHVVRGNDGRIELTSEEGKGSTFTLVFPALR
jgi:two-component system phosphate regulon sensor histidine kinase PhoR